MGLTSTLLLGLPIRFPHGQIRLISSDGKRKAETPRNTVTRLANVEVVFNAIAAGYDTIYAIEDMTGISNVTVKKALHELEDWPTGPRIVRIYGASKKHRHHFQIVSS